MAWGSRSGYSKKSWSGGGYRRREEPPAEEGPAPAREEGFSEERRGYGGYEGQRRSGEFSEWKRKNSEEWKGLKRDEIETQRELAKAVAELSESVNHLTKMMEDFVTATAELVELMRKMLMMKLEEEGKKEE